jgi:hypothetical protein
MKPFLLAAAVGVWALVLSEYPAQAQYYTYSSGYTYPGYSSYYAPNYTYTPSVPTYRSYSTQFSSPYWSAYSNYRNSPTYGTTYFPKPIGYAGFYPGYPTFSTIRPYHYFYPYYGRGYGW